uniref:Uncharacterized protein n=1 Tax=Tetradesmus obliquus TaxID=3088 RepID=A0A383WM32_TETOB|eukprot:jgi/Sobl393_1/623/SZX78505.1
MSQNWVVCALRASPQSSCWSARSARRCSGCVCVAHCQRVAHCAGVHCAGAVQRHRRRLQPHQPCTALRSLQSYFSFELVVVVALLVLLTIGACILFAGYSSQQPMLSDKRQ